MVGEQEDALRVTGLHSGNVAIVKPSLSYPVLWVGPQEGKRTASMMDGIEWHIYLLL
jgi:hypothetical protein